MSVLRPFARDITLLRLLPDGERALLSQVGFGAIVTESGRIAKTRVGVLIRAIFQGTGSGGLRGYFMCYISRAGAISESVARN